MPSTFWQDRRVFVTGCTGLVGSWTVQALIARGVHVIGLVRDQVAGGALLRARFLEHIDVVRGGVEDHALLERALAEYEVQTVLHFAARSRGGADRAPLSTFETNIRGTWAILEAARRAAKTADIVIASSAKAYGDGPPKACPEETPLHGNHPYDVSKACADMLALTYFHTYGLRVCVTRCAAVFGGGDLNWNRIFPATIRALMCGVPIPSLEGIPAKPYLYAKDTAEAYLLLAERMALDSRLPGHAFNFAGDRAIPADEVAASLNWLLLGKPLNSEAVGTLVGNPADKAQTILGWSPRYSLETSLRETLSWYRDYFQRTGRSAA